MPYSRSYKRRHPRAGRWARSYKRRHPRAPMTAYRVKRIIGQELKKFDLAAGPLSIPSVTGIVAGISDIGQGDTNVLRTGNMIQPVSVHGYASVTGNAAEAATNAQAHVRIGLLRWNEDESTQVPTLPVLVADTGNPFCPYSLTNKGRYSILWSRVCIVSNTVENPNFQKLFRFKVKLDKGPKALFSGAAQKKFQYFFFGYSDIPAANEEPLLEFCTSLRFTDS